MITPPRYLEKLHTVPVHMQDTIRAWIETGRPTGHFLHALLSNDLMEAFSRADETNQHAMKAWTIYLCNYVPSGCYGSPDKVKRWGEQGGLHGREAE